MCLRRNAMAGLASYESLPDAITAAALQCPDPRCRCEHVVAWAESGVIATEFAQHHTTEAACGAIKPAVPPRRRQPAAAAQAVDSQ